MADIKIGILGRKIGMTQLFDENRAVIPVTMVAAGPCVVLQKKTPAVDGYSAIQIGLVEKVGRKHNIKPLTGHLKKAATGSIKAIREIRGEFPDLTPGSPVTVDRFDEIRVVDVIGVSKGKGFQGVVTRHHFKGGRATHGSMFHRAPGSIGASSYPSRVLKGMRMAGQMGNSRVTVKNLRLVKVDKESGYLFIRGALPGARGSLVVVQGIE